MDTHLRSLSILTTQRVCILIRVDFSLNWNCVYVLTDVTQHDVLMETMTPREALLFVADLRMYEKFSSQQRQAAVHRVLDALGLIHIADNTIGGTNLRGVSGGERKRVAIGLELVLNPYLIFVDGEFCPYILMYSPLITYYGKSRRHHSTARPPSP